MPLTKFMAGLTLCLGFHTLVNADSYTGFVKDNFGNSLEFVNVTLHSPNDSTFIKATVTDSTGYFELQADLKPLFLKISSIGFEDRIFENPDNDLGDIFLSPVSITLDEIVVKGSKPLAKVKNDGIEVQISGTYLSNAGTALDLIGKLPFVIKTGDEIEVIGKGTPDFYINGRKVRDIS